MVSFVDSKTPITPFEAAARRREVKFGQKDEQMINGNHEGD